MNMKNSYICMTATLVVLAGTAVPAMAGFTSITTCNPTVAAPAGSLISASGDYAVNANLTSASGDCILITVRNVSLKLNGFTITGPNGAGVGVDVLPPSGRVDHVAIQGPGSIQGFTNGITINNADYSQVGQVAATHNLSSGIRGDSDTFLTVSSNVLDGNGVWGLLLTNLTSGTISYNEASGNGGSTSPAAAGGIRITGAANTVNNNVASGNGAQAVSGASFNSGITISANSSRVYSNVTNGNLGPGIQVSSGSTGNLMFNNSSSIGNGTFDLEDDNATCTTDFWSSDVFITRNATCVQ